MFNNFENMEYLWSAVTMVMVAFFILLFIRKFMYRPTYECRYVYKNTIMLMTNSGDDPCECDKELFLSGNYLDCIDNFVIKDDEI